MLYEVITLLHAQRGLGGLDGRVVLARGEAAHRGHRDARGRRDGQHRGRDTDGEHAQLGGLGDERLDVGGSRLRLEQGA